MTRAGERNRPWYSRAMAHGLTPPEVDEAVGRAVLALSRDHRIELAYLFGSATDASSRSPRDLDLAILTRLPLSLDDLTRLRAELVQATGLPVDLVSLNGATTVLAHEVVETGRCLYARHPDVETEFVTRTRSRYWDFAPYRAAQWRLAGERIEERLGGAQS